MTAEMTDWGESQRRVLLAAALLRALATGMAGVLLGVYLAKVGLTPGIVGLVTGAGLAGATVGALAVTLRGERWERRTALLVFGLLASAGGALLENKPDGPLNVLTVWQAGPVTPAQPRRVVVEAEATPDAARGTFTLKLWEAGGPRTITLSGVTFP